MLRPRGYELQRLTIDYLLEGDRRGYTFTTPTDGLAPETVKTLWRGVMPRGQGWGEERYIGARSLKCFPLPSGEAALCDVVVTDLRDELGRKGIRRAAITVLTARECKADLATRLSALPAPTIAAAERLLTSREWQLMVRKVRSNDPPRTLVKPQTVFAYPYHGPESWAFAEACLLLLATRATLLTNWIEVDPMVNPFADRILSFTTLALDHREEGRIVALPIDRVADGLPFIPLSEA